jgi:hypothetical protein
LAWVNIGGETHFEMPGLFCITKNLKSNQKPTQSHINSTRAVSQSTKPQGNIKQK